MVYKPVNQINFKLEEMYESIIWVYMTVRQASVFDANHFCGREDQRGPTRDGTGRRLRHRRAEPGRAGTQMGDVMGI
jgi:hypothetical protein